MARENQRRTEHAWKDRASEASEQQMRAAGKTPDGGGGQQGANLVFGDDPSRPAHVRIVGGDAEFFSGMRRAFGLGEEAQTVSSSESAVESGSGTSSTSIGPRVDEGREGWLGGADLGSSGFGRGPSWEPPPSFQAGLSQGGAQSQAALQLTQEMSLGGMMASQSAVPGSAEALASYTTIQSGQSLEQGGDRVAEMAATLQASYEQQTRMADAVTELTSQISTMVSGLHGGGGQQPAAGAASAAGSAAMPPVPLAPISPPQASQAGEPMSPQQAEQIPSFAQGGLIGPSQAASGRGPSTNLLPAQRTPDTRPPSPQASGTGQQGQERLILAHVGESVLNQEATKLVGPEKILALNRQASGQRSGGQRDRLRGLTGFARGGVIEADTDDDPQRQSLLQRLQRPYADTAGPTTAVGRDGKGDGSPSHGPRSADQAPHPTSPSAQSGASGPTTSAQMKHPTTSPPSARSGGGSVPPIKPPTTSTVAAAGSGDDGGGRGWAARGGDGAAATPAAGGGGLQPPGSGGQPPGPPGSSGIGGVGGSGDLPPLRVHVVSADDAFFQAFSQVFGEGGAGAAPGLPPSRGGGAQRPSGHPSSAAGAPGGGGDDQDDLRRGPTAGEKRARANQRETEDAAMQDYNQRLWGTPGDENTVADTRQMWKGSPQMQAQVAAMSSVGAMKYRSRQRMGEYIQQRWGYESKTEQDPTVTQIKGPEGGFGGYQVQHPGQEEPEMVQPGTDRAKAIHRDDQKKSVASTAGHAMASFGARAALRSLPGVIPGVGTAVMAANSVNQGAEFVANQQAQNQGYQSIYGGTNWGQGGAVGSGVGGFLSGFAGGGGEDRSGFGNRMAEQGFVMKNRFSGGMDEKQSRELFRGVAETGFTGQQRRGALEFGQRNTQQMGMSPDQSMKLISSNAKTAANSFSQLSRSLQGVTKTAKETGQNANQMRETFTQLFDVNANQRGLGSQSAPMAENATRLAGASRQTQGTEQMTAGFSSTLGGRQIMANSMNFQTYDQLAVANEKNPTLIPQAETKRFNQTFGAQYEPFRQEIDKFVQERGGQGKFKGKEGERNRQELTDRARELGMNSDTVKMMGEANGIPGMENLGPDQALGRVVGHFGLNETPESQQQQQIEERRQRPLSDEEKQGRGMWGDIKHGVRTGDLFGRTGALPTARKAIQDETPTAGYASSDPGERQKTAVLEQQANFEKQSGQRSAAMEDFSKQWGSDTGARFRVETGKGARFVDAPTAMRDYRDQFMSGKATVEGGPEHGKPAVEADTGYQVTPEEDTTKQDPRGGMDEEQLKAEEDKRKKEEEGKPGGGGQTVKVHVEPGPKLAEMLQFSGDNVTTTGGAQSGGTPNASGGVIGGSGM